MFVDFGNFQDELGKLEDELVNKTPARNPAVRDSEEDLRFQSYSEPQEDFTEESKRTPPLMTRPSGGNRSF